jgi:uncharacterized membrane protein
MQNLDIIVLSSVVAILFIVFIVSIVKEINRSEAPKGEENSPRAKAIKRIGRVFDSQ